MSNTLERFPWHRLVEAPTGCWLWTGTISAEGYGKYGRGAKYVHRTVFQLLRDDIPPGLQLDHLCRNRRCANPWHVDPVTQRVNVLRGASQPAAQAAQTHCKRGHALDDQNTYLTSAGRRQCRICIRLRWERFAARRKAGLAPPRRYRLNDRSLT